MVIPRPYRLNVWLPTVVTVSISGPFAFLLFRLSSRRQPGSFSLAKITLLYYCIFINQGNLNDLNVSFLNEGYILSTSFYRGKIG